MKKRCFCLMLCITMMLSGCVYKSMSDNSESATVYRVSTSTSGGRLVRERLSYGEEDALQAVVDALNTENSDPYTYCAFPDGVSILSASVEKGVARVDMSREYMELNSAEALLAESAVVLSLCAIDAVCYVDIFCRGELIKGGMQAEMYAEADGLCGAYERDIKIFVPNEYRTNLVPRSLNISDDGSLGSAELVLTELLQALGGGMENTEVLGVELENGLCSVDLSEEFYGAEPTVSFEGMLLVYSIVNSLCRIPGVDSVAVSVEGYAVESYGGFSTPWPLKQNLSLISY